MYDRNKVVELAKSWVGKPETHKHVVDTYNSRYDLCPRKIMMRMDWAWCAATWSALAIELGYQDIMPIEISCGHLINLAMEKGIWIEDDAYIPKLGDGILYDWGDTGFGDNTAWPDHIGTVVYVNPSEGYMTVAEGNYNNAMKLRTISINGKYIRGFITPKYTIEAAAEAPREEKKDIKIIAREVISGVWGTGAQRKEALEQRGYNYAEVQAEVNRILNGDAVTAKDPAAPDQNQPAIKEKRCTCYAKSHDDARYRGPFKATTDLYCRNDAGSNKKALCIIPKNTTVQCYGYYTNFQGRDWLLVTFVMDGVRYQGFSSSKYLEKISK